MDGLPAPGTDWSESVRNFQNFAGPGPVLDFKIFRSWFVDPCKRRFIFKTPNIDIKFIFRRLRNVKTNPAQSIVH